MCIPTTRPPPWTQILPFYVCGIQRILAAQDKDKNVIFCCPLITSFRARKVLDIKKKEKNYFDAFIYISSEKMITMCAF